MNGSVKKFYYKGRNDNKPPDSDDEDDEIEKLSSSMGSSRNNGYNRPKYPGESGSDSVDLGSIWSIRKNISLGVTPGSRSSVENTSMRGLSRPAGTGFYSRYSNNSNKNSGMSNDMNTLSQMKAMPPSGKQWTTSSGAKEQTTEDGSDDEFNALLSPGSNRTGKDAGRNFKNSGNRNLFS